MNPNYRNFWEFYGNFSLFYGKSLYFRLESCTMYTWHKQPTPNNRRFQPVRNHLPNRKQFERPEFVHRVRRNTRRRNRQIQKGMGWIPHIRDRCSGCVKF